MEKSRDASPEKPDERTRDNRITNDKDNETDSKEEHILIGRSDNSNNEKAIQHVEDDTIRGSNEEGVCLLSPDEIKHIVANLLTTVSAESSKGPSGELRPSSDNVFRTPNRKEPLDTGIKTFGTGEYSKHRSKISRRSFGKQKKAYAKTKSGRSNSKKNKTVHSRGGSRVPKPITIAEKSNPSTHASSSKERTRKNKKKFRENAGDVFEKMRNRVRYILNKIKYEQSLIDAYGGEGWKGMSIDKLKPERELQRARSEILQCKLRLRELFQRLDALCTEGAYPESMFDSEGLLDSEDIYCTICGSEEISADNDIILCDGECNRAFHQLCLKPPLLTEEIPLEDQGWLCPGCDCKFDCTELLNDFFGSDLSMKDNWTCFFPEAAAASSNIIDEIIRLPSDDSEDDDFNPDNMDVDKDQSGKGGDSYEGEESASDDSDFSSASEDIGDFINKGQLMEKLPGNVEEDDEDDDDDYDPDGPDPDNTDGAEIVKVDKSVDGGESSEGEGSASDESDFSSASEDLDDFVCKQLKRNNSDNSEGEHDESGPDVQEPDQQNEEESSGTEFASNDIGTELDYIISTVNENSEIVSAETEQDSHVPVSKKRDIKRLDYKKLFDETYGNVSSDSSDDEEWSEVGPSRKKRDRIKRDGSTMLKSKKGGSADDEQPMNTESKPQEAEDGTSRRFDKKLKSTSDNDSMAKASRSSLGQTAIQKLSEAFHENHYPERSVKEVLAKDLGLSYQKVDKWFGNARWSFKHPLHARTVSKSNLATKSPSQIKSGSKVVLVNNSSRNDSSQNLPEGKTTVSGASVKISSPQNPTSADAKDKHGPGQKLNSPYSSTAEATIQGDASNTPPSQPIKRRSARFQESHTSISSGDDDNKGGTDNDSGTKKGNSSSRNTKQKGKREQPSAKKVKKA